MTKHGYRYLAKAARGMALAALVLPCLAFPVYAQERASEFRTGKIFEDQLSRIHDYISELGATVISYESKEDEVRLAIVSREKLELDSVAGGLFTAIGNHIHRLEIKINSNRPVVITPSMIGRFERTSQPIANVDQSIQYVEVSSKERIKTSLADTSLNISFGARYNKDLTSRVVDYARAAADGLPEEAKLINVTLLDQDAEIARYSFVTRHLQKLNDGEITSSEVYESTNFVYGIKKQTQDAELDLPAVFDIGFMPDVENQIGKGKTWSTNYYAAIEAKIAADNGLSLNVRIRKKIGGNYENLPPQPETHNLPIVRSDQQLFLANNDLEIEKATVSYGLVPSDDYYAQLTVGHLETMYAGIRMEAVYMPPYDKWSASWDVAAVKKREPGSQFDLSDEKVRFTGHFTMHRELPGSNVHFSVSAGRYLAGDWGVTSELKKTFDNGITVGAYNTKTTASKSLFGRAGDQRGIFVHIPLSFGSKGRTIKPMRFTHGYRLHDAGQKLTGGDALYERFRVVKDWRVRSGWPAQ